MNYIVPIEKHDGGLAICQQLQKSYSDKLSGLAHLVSQKERWWREEAEDNDQKALDQEMEQKISKKGHNFWIQLLSGSLPRNAERLQTSVSGSLRSKGIDVALIQWPWSMAPLRIEH